MSESEQRTGVLPSAPVSGPLGGDDDEPPSKPRRHPLLHDVPDSQWDNWHWQSQNAIRSVRQLRELLPFAPDELEIMGRLEGEYKLAIPPYYFSLIDPAVTNDPIRLQSVTSPREAENPSGFELEDPLEEDKDSPVPGLTHRYPDRALLVTTHVCTMYCRFCTRKRATMVRGGWDAVNHNDERMIEYIRTHPEIRDVIVSGGDPLTLPTGKLKFFLDNLKAIPHVDIVRIGTRVPVTLPQRLYDRKLIRLLADAEKVWIQTHFNHPREITPEAERVCKSLLRAGMPVNNHIVLLKGVNDDLETMRDLCRSLLRIKVRPYYLFHCDPVIGGALPHLRMEGLGVDGRLAGTHVRVGHSHLCRGQSARGRKIPLMPELPRLGLRRCGDFAHASKACWSAIKPRTSRSRSRRPGPAASVRCARHGNSHRTGQERPFGAAQADRVGRAQKGRSPDLPRRRPSTPSRSTATAFVITDTRNGTDIPSADSLAIGQGQDFGMKIGITFDLRGHAPVPAGAPRRLLRGIRRAGDRGRDRAGSAASATSRSNWATARR